jgi:hypothetical protein
MADYLGIRPAGSDVYFSFTTHAATGGTVAPLSAFEAGDLRIYRNSSDTERTSTSGYTMTSPFGSVTGLHHVSIDLSDGAHAGFYDLGYFYTVVLVPDETVDGETVAKVLAYFEIGPPVVHSLPVGSESAKDVTLGQTVFLPFMSRGAASGTAAFKIWRDGSLTQRTSSAGIAFNDSFDGEVSVNLITVDTSNDTDAGFYRRGSHYMLLCEGITVDGHTISTLHEFGIEYFHEPFRLTVGETVENIQTGAVDFTTDISDETDQLVGQAVQFLDASGQGRVIITSDHTTETVQFDADLSPAVAEDTRVKRFAGSPSYTEPGVTDLTTEALEQGADKILGRNIVGGSDGETSVSTVFAAIEDNVDAPLSTIDTNVDAILVDTAEIGAAGAGLTNINLPNQTMDIVGNITGNLSGSVGSVTGAVGSVTGNVGGNVAGSVGSVTGAVGSVTGNVGGNVTGSVGSLAAQAKADVNAEADTALTDIHLDHLLAATYDPASKPGASDALLNELIENDGGVARYTANALEQAPTGGSAPTAADIADAVWDEDLTGHVVADSAGAILGDVATGTPPTAAAIADAVWDEATSGHTTSGTFGEQVKTDIDAILVDTDVIGAAGVGLTEAGGTGDQLTAVPWNASWDAEVQSEVADALEATISDSIPSDGTLPSVKQALYMLTQFMFERSVSSTTCTVKKADGSTSLFTLTLNDDTTPTSITRTT